MRLTYGKGYKMNDADLTEKFLPTPKAPEYRALEHLFLALVYELNESPDFPRRGLIQTLGKFGKQLEADGEFQAAKLVFDTQVGLELNLGD